MTLRDSDRRNEDNNEEVSRMSRPATVEDIRRLEGSIAELKSMIADLVEKHTATEIWKATTDARLANGSEKMASIDKEMNEKITALDKTFAVKIAEVDKKVDGMVEKRVLWAYLTGAVAGGAGAGAGLVKLFGG
jgi:galactokinase